MIEQTSMDRIQLHYTSAGEFLFSMARLALNDTYNDLSKIYNISLNDDVVHWTDHVLHALSEEQKYILDFYFNEDGYFGLGLCFLMNEMDGYFFIRDFITAVKECPAEDLIYYLLSVCFENHFDRNLLKNFKNNNEVFNWIEENTSISRNGKWKMIEMLMRPDKVKKELVQFLNYYYINFYMEKEKQVESFMLDYIRNNEERLKGALVSSISDNPSRDSQKDGYSDNKKEVLVSYFIDFGVFLSFEQLGFLVGYRYPELKEKLWSNKKSLSHYIPIFKVLADQTRLKVLLEIKKGPTYLTQLAETLNCSNPAVKYHLDKLLDVGLIEVAQSQNRIYYKLKQDTFIELIQGIKESLNIDENSMIS